MLSSSYIIGSVLFCLIICHRQYVVLSNHILIIYDRQCVELSDHM